MSKGKTVYATTTFISFDFAHGRYETSDTPMMKKLLMKPSGSIQELEESGAVLEESVRDFHVTMSNLLLLYDKGMEGDSELHELLYLVSSDASEIVPVSVRLVLIWDEESGCVNEAIGSMSLAKKISVKQFCKKHVA